MNFLFDNPLANMTGFNFLVFYVFVVLLLAVVFSILKRRLDSSARLPLPVIPASPDPYEIAFLRGGENEIARAVTFSLTQKGLIQIVSEGNASRIERIKTPSDTRSLNQMEQTAAGWFGVAREPKEIFDSQNGLTKVLEPYWRAYQHRLERGQMLADARLQNALKPVKYLFAAIIAGLGGYKLFVALINGRTNVLGIIAVGIVGLLIFRFVSKLPRVTKLGNAYLERLQLAFDGLKTQVQKPFVQTNAGHAAPQTTFAGIDPLLLSVGVFGSAVLAGTMYEDYNRAFQRAQASGGGGSACGSSCGSSDSSSSSDGGSSCGSGCGGCGGGGD